MPKQSRQPVSAAVQLELPLAMPDYRVFVVAVRKLRRIMGSAAPTLIGLISFNLSNREPTGVASHYLESHRWPVSAKETLELHRPAIRRKGIARRQAISVRRLPCRRTDAR